MPAPPLCPHSPAHQSRLANIRPPVLQCFFFLICRGDVVTVPSSRLAGRFQQSGVYHCPVPTPVTPGVHLSLVHCAPTPASPGAKMGSDGPRLLSEGSWRFPHCRFPFLPWHLWRGMWPPRLRRSLTHSESELRAVSGLGAQGKPVGGDEAGELSHICSENTSGVFQGFETLRSPGRVVRREGCAPASTAGSLSHSAVSGIR